MPTKEDKKSQPNKFIVFSGLGLQMGLTIYLGHYLGEFLDQKYGNEDGLYEKGITLLAVFISIYLVIRQAIRLSKD